MKLEDIGFYTLCDNRAENVSNKSPMWRCEMILTGRCNFKCPYCRGLKCTDKDMSLECAMGTLDTWIKDGLKHVRFSGGEPTLYPWLRTLVEYCKDHNVKRIAISTNGSRDITLYKELVGYGVNDFSISLDACCSSFGDKMAGVSGQWENVVNNIKELSKITYVTVGVVLTEDNVQDTKQIIEFASGLDVSDIRIISAAQYNMLLDGVTDISQSILDKHPILKYRINNIKKGRNVRGISKSDCHQCHLVKDDSVVAGKWHFPCVIHMREGGNPIGEIGSEMRKDRVKWFTAHNSYEDPICQKNCLDICIDYNNKCSQIGKS